MKLQLAKGVNDSSPEEMIELQSIMSQLRLIFEKYGFVPLDTPVIERFDVLSAKYAGGSEILKETFKLTDQGGRELGLRYDLTVPFARYVGMNPTLKLPFKRYQMGKVWRDGPVGLARFREFWQCDVDIVGSKKMSADAEILALANHVFKDMKLETIFSINNRKLLNGLLDFVGVESNKDEMILIIDKLKKVSKKELFEELQRAGMSEDATDKLFELINMEGNSREKLSELSKLITSDEGREGITELEELFDYLDAYEIKNYELDLALSRGLAFYTATVFETTLVDSEVKSSVASGGRYDQVISQFLGSKNEYPCVGISFGLSRIKTALSKTNVKDSVTQVFVIPLGNDKACLKILTNLRNNNINSEIDLMGRALSKNLNYANTKKIPFVVIVGEDEISQNKYKLRDMKSGEEQVLSLSDITRTIIKKLKI